MGACPPGLGAEQEEGERALGERPRPRARPRGPHSGILFLWCLRCFSASDLVLFLFCFVFNVKT